MTTRKKTQKSTQQALNTGAQMFGRQPYTTVEDVKGTPNMVEQSMPPPTKAWTPTNWKQWDEEQQENQYQSEFERGRRYDTENKPIDTNIQTPLYQMSQQEQVNRASESSKKIFSDMEVGMTVSDLIKKGEKDAADAAREVQSKTSPYVDDNGFSAFATLRAANEARTPSKLVKDFQSGLQDKMEYLVYSHSKEIEDGAKDARMDVPTYIDKYVVPQYLSQIETSLRDEVRKGYMPKSDFEYIMSGVKDWVPGMLVRIATQTGEQYALEDEAKQQYGDKASWGVKALNEGMAFVDPTFGMAFGAGRAAGKTIQSAVTSGVNRAVQTKIGQKLAPVAVQKAADYAAKFGTGAQAAMAKLIDRSGSSRVGSFLKTYSKELPAEIIGQSLGMNLYGSLSGGVSTYGQTRDIYEAGKVAWEGLTSKEGVASGTAFAIGMPILHNLYGLSGLGWKAGDSLLKKTVMGGAKLAFEGASVLGTAGVMTAGHNLGYFLNGEDMDWTLNTFMEQTTTAAAMKYNPNLLKRLSQWPKMLKNMGSKETNNPLPFRLEKEEVDMILDLTHTETLSDALYTIFPDLGTASGKLRDVDARVTEARKNYLRLMNQLPWDTANKINMLTGSMTIARPRAASYEYNGKKLMEIGEDGSILSVKEVTSREQAEAYIAEKKIAQNNADLVKSWFDAYRNNKDEMDRRVDAFEKEHNLKSGTLYSILLSDPMSRIGTNRELLLEQAAMQMEDLFRPRGKAHVDQSRIEGENVANDADILGAAPNVEAIRALDAEVDREQANFESALARAPWRKEYQSLKGKGMSDADALATLSDKYKEADLAPLADFVNAQAKQEGFLSAVGHSVDSKVSERVNTLTYRMDDKGEKVQHDDVIELVDADGNIVHLVGGVSGKTSVVNGKEYLDGDLMVIVDANGETHAVKTSDYSINRRLAKSDYDAEYREALGVKATQIIDPTEKLNPERIKQESLKRESAKEESAKEPLKTEEPAKEELAEEPVKEEKPAEEEPRDERGDLDFVNERVTPDRAVEEIYDRNGLTEAEAGDFVAEKKAEAEKLYTEASNEPVTRNTGEGLSEFAQRKAEYNAKVEGLKRNLEKWNQIETAAERRNMTKTGAELTAMDLDARERDIKRQTEERVDELATKLGDVEKVYDISEVTNPDALAELEAGRTVYGWYDKKKDKIVLYMPNVTNPRVATRTIIHEQVIHRGLSKMFGEDYDNVLAEVYDKVMTPSEQKEFYEYVNGPKKGKEEDIRKKQLEAADEWIANNHESLRFKQYNVWSNLISSVRGILRKNGFDVDYTRRDIENLVRDSYRNLEKGGVKEGNLSDVAGDKEREGIMLKYYDKEVNDRFNEELEQQINGTLPRGHIYQMGMPGTVLRACGFPDMPIEMSSTNLAEHARKTHHPFELKDVKDLVRALQEPVAVFAYGNKDKSQNVIAEIQKDGKNFLVGIHFNQSRNGLEVSSIRGIFPKDNAEWLNWVSQGKTLYLDKEKIQALIAQQRKTLADVEYLDLDSVAKLVNDFENPKLSEEENASAEQDLTNVSENGTRFSKSNENQRIFVSNAEKAVEGIKQEKGTPEQWLKMIEKGGGLKDKVLNVVDVPRHDFTGTGNEAIHKARKWAKENLLGEYVVHENTDEEFRYSIDIKAIKKYLSGIGIEASDNLGVHLSVLKVLPDVIENSIEAEIHADYKKVDSRNIDNGIGDENLLIHRFYGGVNIDGKLYRVKTTLKEKKNDGVKPYTYEVKNIELLGGSSQKGTSPSDAPNNSISAAKLLNGVEKSYDKGKKLLTESKTLTPVNKNTAFRKDYKAEKAKTEDRLLKGNLRETLGKGYTGFVRNLWENKDNPLYKDMHAYVNKEMQKNGFDVNKGVESFLVSKIGSNDRAFWENVRDAYAEGMKEAGNDWKPNLVDVQYGLWLSSKKGNMNDPLFKAEAVAMRDKIAKSLPPVEVVDGAYVDTDTRFRKPVLTPAAQAARDEYDRRVSSQVSRSREAFIDAMESLRVFQEVVGGKDVEDLKNAYVRENLESSIAHVEWEKYQERINKPLSQAVDKIITYMGVGGREGMKQITDYMIQKHGLERNRVMYVRDAIRDIDNPKKAEQMQTDWDTDQAMLRGLLSSGSISFSEYLDMTDTYIRDNVDADYDPNKNDKSGISTYDSNRKLKGNKVEYDESYIRDLVELFESEIDPSDMQNLWDRVREATGFTLDYSYKSGMITAGARDAMKNMFSFYVPLRGYSAETMEEHYGDYLSGGSGKDLNVIKNAEGRKSEADNPLAYIANMAQGAILSGEKNVTKQHFYRLVEGNDKAPVAISEIWEVKNPQGVWEIATPDLTGARPDEIADIVHTFNEDMRNLQQNGDARIAHYQSAYRFPFEQKAHREEHIVPVNIGGQRKLMYILADPRVAQALNGKLVNDGTANTFKLGRQALNVMSTFATSYSPEFILSNTSRDTLFANSNIASKENAAYFGKFTKNQAKAAQILAIPNLFSQYYDGTWDKSNYYRRMFAEFMDNGGRTGFIAMSKVEDMKKQLEKELTPNSTSEEVARKVGDFLQVVPGWVEAVNARSENLNRFATYLTSREMGRSEQRSASDAKEVSVNFNRKGAGSATGGVTGAVASYFRNNMMFFNAGMQATELMYRNLSKDKKTAAKTVAFQALVPMAGSAIWAALMTLGDDDKYSQIPHWDRRNNICIPLKDTYIKIPLPVELRAFWGMGDIIAGAIDKKLQTGDNVMYELASQAASVMPLDVMGQNQEQLTKWWHVVEALSPDFVNPVFQANRNMTWNGRPIERDDDFLPAYEKAFANTPTLLVEMSKYAHAKTREGEHTAQDTDLTGWQISPGIVHHFLGSYLTGIYSLTLKTASAGTDIANGEFNVARTPFVSRVLGSYKTGEGSAVIRAKYYKYKKEFDEVSREYNNMANRTNELAMQELLNSARYKRLLVAKGYMGFISKLQELNNQATDPEAKKEISALIDNAMADIVEATDSIE